MLSKAVKDFFLSLLAKNFKASTKDDKYWWFYEGKINRDVEQRPTWKMELMHNIAFSRLSSQLNDFHRKRNGLIPRCLRCQYYWLHSRKKWFCLREPVFWGVLFRIFRSIFPDFRSDFPNSGAVFFQIVQPKLSGDFFFGVTFFPDF